MKFILNRILVIGGSLLVLFGTSLLMYLNQSQPVINESFNSKVYHPSKTDSTLISGIPNELTIPSLGMDLQIIPGYYNAQDQTWNLTLSKVQYAVSTPPANNHKGATFLYGHYRPEVFAYLHTIKAAAEAIIKTTDNHTFYYQLASIRTTTPQDDSVFHYTGPPVLEIQTCTGSFFQYRQFYTFNLVKAI